MTTSSAQSTYSSGSKMRGLTLYEIQITPSCRRVRMFLAEKGLAVETIEVSDGSALADWFAQRYRQRLVPMLELEDGTQIAESMAICRYFEVMYPTPPLMGVTPKQQAVIEMWERRAENEGISGCEDIFRNSDPRMVDRGLPGTPELIP